MAAMDGSWHVTTPARSLRGEPITEVSAASRASGRVPGNWHAHPRHVVMVISGLSSGETKCRYRSMGTCWLPRLPRRRPLQQARWPPPPFLQGVRLWGVIAVDLLRRPIPGRAKGALTARLLVWQRRRWCPDSRGLSSPWLLACTTLLPSLGSDTVNVNTGFLPHSTPSLHRPCLVQARRPTIV